ncbi:MAG TPA: HEPN domain-containing protein [bacterium]|nr:HEPN domain-containing protein [bacterium]
MDGYRLLIFQRWLLQGRRDLKAAEVLQKSGAYEWAAFLAQQAAERVLKAFLYFHGEESVMGHSIRSLVHKCSSYAAAFEVVHDAGRIDEFYTAPRFPDSFGEDVPADAITPEKAEVAVELARMVVELVDKLASEEG